MDILPQFVDMAQEPREEGEDYSSPSLPMYPPGLSICLYQEQLDKLDLDDDVEPGDMVHLFCMAKVTSVSKRDTADGPDCRVELQITHIACENEDEENEESEAPRRMDYDKFYKK